MEGRGAENERQPMNRDARGGPEEQQPGQNGGGVPDTRYPRSIEGIIRIVSVVSKLNLFLHQYYL